MRFGDCVLDPCLSENFICFFDLGMKAITNSDAEHRVTYSLIKSSLDKQYFKLTQMKFLEPPKNASDYGKTFVAELSDLHETIVRGYQELELWDILLG